ncbi:MAG: hypothetical protein V8Q40_06075 [Anaerosacchariphilus sp.]
MYQMNQLYDTAVQRAAASSETWKEVLRLNGRLYRYEWENILLIWIQRPNAVLAADYDSWKKVDRYVCRGSRGIGIFPSRALKSHLRYVFDFKDTGGRNRKLTWDLEGPHLKEYLDYLVESGQMEAYDEKGDEKAQKNLLNVFTGTNVWSMIKADYSERISESGQENRRTDGKEGRRYGLSQRPVYGRKQMRTGHRRAGFFGYPGLCRRRGTVSTGDTGQ